MIRAPQASSARDAGLTLVETLVVMLLMGILGGVLLTWFIATQRATMGYTARIADLSDVQVAVDRFSKDVRMAIRPSSTVPAFLASSSADEAAFYVSRDTGAPLLVRYRVTSAGGQRQLVREVTVPTGAGPYTWPTTDMRRQVVIPALAPSATVSFAYYRRGDAGLPGCEAGVTAGCATPMPASPALTDPDDVGAVELTVRQNSRADLSGPTDLRSRTRIVNAGLTFVD